MQESVEQAIRVQTQSAEGERTEMSERAAAVERELQELLRQVRVESLHRSRVSFRLSVILCAQVKIKEAELLLCRQSLEQADAHIAQTRAKVVRRPHMSCSSILLAYRPCFLLSCIRP